MSRLFNSFVHFTIIFLLTTSPAFAQTTNEIHLKKFLPKPSVESTQKNREHFKTESDRAPENPESSLIYAQCIPGTIEAESYYEMSGVGTEPCFEGGLNVGNVQPGDWFKYKVNVIESGTYLVEYRVASETGGEIILDQDGTSLYQITVPQTGSWQNWTTISHLIDLNAGIQNLAIYVSQGAYNVNWLRFTKLGNTIPGTIEAANYSAMSGIQTEDSQDGGGQSVGSFTTNDWAEYAVHVDQTTTYFVEFRVAADVGFGGEFAFQVDGNPVETIIVKPTLGWYNWKNVGVFIDLSKGPHTIRITALTSYNGPANDTINLHWMKFSKRKLAWSDEFLFSTGGKPAASKWSPEIQNPFWVNNEQQYYTDRIENAHVENKMLTIEARKDLSVPPYITPYSSARLKSKGSWLNGRVEIRAKLAGGVGAWPAIWLLSANEGAYGSYGGWPAIGEIDIMEHVGFEPGIIHGSAHNDTYNGILGNNPTFAYGVGDAETAFHIYAVEWFEDRIDYYVDNVKYFTVYNDYSGWQTWPYDKPFYLILNVAVGGTWGGQQGIDNGAFPMKMVVDYVRVYQKGSTASSTQQCPVYPESPKDDIFK